MKAKFGSLIVAGSGKIGGHVVSKNRGGAYLRTKVTPSNPQTSSQSNVRNIFTSLSQAWKGLTEDQRNAWNAAVSNFQRTDIFGDLKSPSGINLFQRLNNNLTQIGKPTLTEPPLPSEVSSVSIFAVQADVATNLLTVGVLPFSLPMGSSYVVRASAPVSPGISYAKNLMRVVSVESEGSLAPIDITAEYTQKYGGIGQVGQKIFVDILPINSTTGQSGSITSGSCIVGA
jgi:hypothetical protein